MPDDEIDKNCPENGGKEKVTDEFIKTIRYKS
jgi:hypothetical protein